MNDRIVLWGVWYTDGELNEGWLASDSNHGRGGRWESTEEFARAQAKTKKKADLDSEYVALPLNMHHADLELAKIEARRRIRAYQRRRWGYR